MTKRHSTPVNQWTRRETLQLGMAASTGMLLGVSSLSAAQAQGTPAAPPDEPGEYANPDALVDAAWLAANRSDSSAVVVGFMPAEEFEVAHIPGSVQLDWPELEVIDTSDASIESWQGAVEQMLADLGISRESTVVAYDNGTLFAARLWWILHYLGHENVHVLDGGLAAWQEAGNEVEDGPSTAVAAAAEPYRGSANAGTLAQLDEVTASLDDPAVAILDARTAEEYAEGHIPGAVNINFPLNALPEPPKLWKPANELRAMYEAEGVTPDKTVIPYCASGVRSAVTAFSLHLLGYDNIALYTGSWLEWGETPETPKTEGDQP